MTANQNQMTLKPPTSGMNPSSGISTDILVSRIRSKVVVASRGSRTATTAVLLLLANATASLGASVALLPYILASCMSKILKAVFLTTREKFLAAGRQRKPFLRKLSRIPTNPVSKLFGMIFCIPALSFLQCSLNEASGKILIGYDFL